MEEYGITAGVLFEGANHAPVVPPASALILEDAILKDPNTESGAICVGDTSVEEDSVEALSVFLAEIEDNDIVRLSTAIEGRVEEVAHEGASILLAVGRRAHVLGNVQGVHLNVEETCRSGGNGRKNGYDGRRGHWGHLRRKGKEKRREED